MQDGAGRSHWAEGPYSEEEAIADIQILQITNETEKQRS